MKPSILQKLESLRDRYEEVGHLLSDPDVIGDQDKFRNLSKEYAELEEVAKAYSDYEQAVSDQKEAEVLASDDDPDMRAMGQEELESAKVAIADLESRIEILLLPKDPDDSRNVIVEIRAGTGGDEAAIFSGDLYRMYTRFAETQGWRTEMMSANEGETKPRTGRFNEDNGKKELLQMINSHRSKSRKLSTNKKLDDNRKKLC